MEAVGLMLLAANYSVAVQFELRIHVTLFQLLHWKKHGNYKIHKADRLLNR